MNEFTTVLKKYAIFTGRARRREYWMYNGVMLLIMFILGIIGGIAGMTDDTLNMLAGLIGLALLLPTLAVTVRRLHDTGRSGWWALLNIIPFVNLVVFVFTILDSQPTSNKWGPSPKDVIPYSVPV